MQRYVERRNETFTRNWRPSSSGAGNVSHSMGPSALTAAHAIRLHRSLIAEKNSASRWRFRPPRPTGLPPRGCPLFVEPLGRGFDLVALRARCKGEAIRSVAAV